MKKFYTYSIFAILGMVFSLNSNAQLVVENTMTVEELVLDVLLGEGVTASNITFNGMPGNEVTVQAGTFNSTNSNIPIQEGLIMATGNIEVAIGPNTLGSASDNLGFESFVGDPDLLALIEPNTIADCSIIEFDFEATSDSIQFNYVFASEEYDEWVCSSFNDAFGFFLSGPGISGPYTNDGINIALVPDTDIPVAINTVNLGVPGGGDASPCEDTHPDWDQNAEYYISYSGNMTDTLSQYDGMTVKLTARAQVQCGGVYHIKLAIGDGGSASFTDTAYDSAVFLEAGSFAASGEVFVDVNPSIGGVTISDPQYEDVIVAGCSEFGIELTRPTGAVVDSVFVVFGGTAIENQDYILGENDTLQFFPEGVDTLRYQIQTLWDGIPDENEELEIMVIYPVGCSGDYDTLYASLPFVDPYELESSTTGITLICPTDIAEISAQGGNGIGPYIYNWGDYGTNQEAIINDPPEPGEQQYYQVLIGDQCTENSTGGFEPILDSALVINNIAPPLQASVAPFEQPTCPNEPVLLESVVVDGAPEYTFVWRTIDGDPISSQENATAQFIFDRDVTLTVIDQCGTQVGDTVSLFYPQYDSLIVSFPPLENNCPSSPLAATAEYTGGAGDVQFLWTQLEGDGEFVMPVDSQNTAVVPGSGNNVYSVTATDRCYRQGYFGLTPGSSTFVDSLKTINLSNLPNVITPNDDNRNDFFVVKGIEEFDNARLEVFDRWGRLVYETDNYTAGTAEGSFENAFDGKDLEDGTYFYVINVELGECTQSGTIQILRSDN